ncbi:CC191 protein, partial [Upupa epops]|nr:CC191 protein [Upupa epops]
TPRTVLSVSLVRCGAEPVRVYSRQPGSGRETAPLRPRPDSRVYQASKYAASETFSPQKSRYPERSCDPATSLETVEQLQDYDEARDEAQELLSNWMKSKLQLEQKNDEEEEADSVLLEKPSASPLKLERFDDMCSYLEQELESSSVQEYLQHLLQDKAVNRGIMEKLKLQDIREEGKLLDPRITMELRHKQVKENRMRRQKALELQRQEKLLKKSVLFEAKCQAQEEDRKQALKAKKEDKEIQRKMVMLRKEMAEKRQAMAETQRMERKRQEKNQMLTRQEMSTAASPPHVLKKEEQEEEKERKVQELLHRIHMNKQRCMQRYFSAWLKVILEHRIKMAKARTLADWKCQLKALRAWRNYTRARKVEKEAKQLKVHLQEQNRKNQLSTKHNQRRVLRRCFLAWQRCCQAEREKEELQMRREARMRKMALLLETPSPRTGSLDRSLQVNKPGTAEVNSHQDLQQDKVNSSHMTPDNTWWDDGAHTSHSYKKSLFACKIPLNPAVPSAQDQAVHRNQTAMLPQRFQAPGRKTGPSYGSCFEYRHAFQQRLIEEQRQQLQKQQKLILELQENQRLSRAKEEAAQATSVAQTLNSASQTREENQSTCKNAAHLSLPVSHGPENTQAVIQGRRPSSQQTSTHPILQAMEKRAAQRAEQRRKLKEAKQQKEMEKLAQLKAEEEARQRKEAEEKEAQQEKWREERRQQKLKEMEKQRRMEKEQQLQKKARDHYEKVLLRKLGIVPWKKLREQAKENLVVAQRHHCLSLQRKCLMTWLQDTQRSIVEKVSRTKNFYSHTLLRKGFRNWLKYKNYLSALEERASTLHAACLTRKYFRAWFDLMMEEKRSLDAKLKIATEHSDKRLMLNAFQAWKLYLLMMKKEREREERRNQLRRRVSQILPNFQT